MFGSAAAFRSIGTSKLLPMSAACISGVQAFAIPGVRVGSMRKRRFQAIDVARRHQPVQVGGQRGGFALRLQCRAWRRR